MFERFTDRARRVVVLAMEEARLLNHDWIGSEHILLGLLNEDEGVAAQALVASGVDLDSARREVTSVIGRGAGTPEGHIPFTPRAKKILELSLRESLSLGHQYIGTEHILLGLLREGEGVANQVLEALGVDESTARANVLELLGERDPGRRDPLPELDLPVPTRPWPGMRRGGFEDLGIMALSLAVILVSLLIEGGDDDYVGVGVGLIAGSLLLLTTAYLMRRVSGRERSVSSWLSLASALLLVAAALVFLYRSLF